MLSVVIPAHNEERTIDRCLESLLEDAREGELEIVVVCNGCTDRTAEAARAFSPRVAVLETPVASKSNALNLGDASATAFPRFYVDADIEVRASALRRCAAEMETRGRLAAAPRLHVDLTDCPWTVRAYYRLWLEIPYVAHGLIGSGVYGVSEEGRARFGRFPTVIADDLFVRNLFRQDERCSVEDVTFTMRAARSIADLIQRKTRVFAGNLQLARQRPPEGAVVAPGRAGILGVILRRPGLLPTLPIYLYVSALSHWRARSRARSGDFVTWDRDESTR